MEWGGTTRMKSIMKNIQVSLGFVFIYLIFGFSGYAQTAAKNYEASKQQAVAKFLEKRLNYFVSDFIIEKGSLEESTEIQEGIVIMGGMVNKFPFKLARMPLGISVNGLEFIPRPLICGLKDQIEYPPRFSEVIEAGTKLTEKSEDLCEKNVSKDEYTTEMQKSVDEFRDLIKEKIITPGFLRITFITETCVEFGCMSDNMKNDHELNKRTVQDDLNDIAYNTKRYKNVCDCLKGGKVIFQPDVPTFYCCDMKFYQDLKKILDEVDVDLNKTLSEYEVYLDRIIELFHKNKIRLADMFELNSAAVILANWTRNPGDVIREARKTTAAKQTPSAPGKIQ
jgi:hypothetical protein